MKRTLHLRTEVLSELTTDELQNVAGGDGTTYACSRYECPTLDHCVPTLPLNVCVTK
ncbi:MAG TPA: bacteriocin [Frankiaceae bacterium]|nr:bacteriocin [Frankiaceae bacterium]